MIPAGLAELDRADFVMPIGPFSSEGHGSRRRVTPEASRVEWCHSVGSGSRRASLAWNAIGGHVNRLYSAGILRHDSSVVFFLLAP